MSQTPTDNPPPRADLPAMGRDFWSPRPRRPRTKEGGRRVAGVAAAVAARYDVDPVLVRVFLVVTTFYGGAGIITYLAGWVFLPIEDDEVSPAEALVGRGRSTQSELLTVLLGCALAAVLTGLLFSQDTSTVLSLVLSAGALVLLHHYRAGRYPVAGPTSGGQAGTRPVPTWVPGPPAPGPMPARAAGPEPTGDDGQVSARPPGGAASVTGVGFSPGPVSPGFAGPPPGWSPPPPPRTDRPRPPRRRGRGTRVTAVTIAVVLLAIAGMLTATALTDGPRPQAAFGIILAILGAGILAGSIVGGGRLLLLPALPLAFVLMVTSTEPWNRHWDRVAQDGGDRYWTVVEPTDLRPEYRMGFGEGVLDLTGLRLTTEDTVRTALRVTAGEARVLLPRDADIDVRCHGSGRLNCLTNTIGGPNHTVTAVDDGPDGPGGGKIILEVSVSIGNVEVTRG